MTEEEEIDVDQSELNISNKPVHHLPVDTETLESNNTYSNQIKLALEPNTVLKREMTIFHLRNQVIQAGFMNCNLTRIIHALEWRNSLYKHKYEIKRNVCRQQQAHIRSLEDMLDHLHESYNHLIKLMEKQELDLLHKPSLLESQFSFSKAKIVRPVSSQNFKGGFVGRKDKSSKTLAPIKALTPNPVIQGRRGSDSVVKMNSFMESEVDTYTVNKKLKFLEANLQIQKMYNLQIKQVLEENKDECTRIKSLLSTFETNVFQTQKQERDKWNSFLNEFKMNCEQELMRKHEEVVRLNSVLADWIHKFMELQQKTGIPSSKGHQKSLSNQFMDELRKLYESTSAATSPMDSFLRIEENFRLSPIRSDMYYTPRISRTCIGDADPILDID